MESRRLYPDDIIFQILSFCDPLDVLTARSVSRQFRDITHGHDLWSSLYRTAPLPRPPGPYPYQSTKFLERTLVRSTQLAQSWTTQPLRVTSCREIPKGSSMVCSRWIVTSSQGGFLFHDTLAPPNPDHPRSRWQQIIRRSTQEDKTSNKTPFSLFRLFSKKKVEIPMMHTFTWTACDTMSVGGHFIYILVGARTGKRDTSAKWTFWIFQVDAESDQPVFRTCLDVPATQNAHPSRFFVHPSFIYMGHLNLVFSMQTWSFYQFPTFHTELDNRVHFPERLEHSVQLTRTHILVITASPRSFDRPHPHGPYLMQAFTLPDESESRPILDNPPILQVTHEFPVDFRRPRLLPWKLMRDSIVNPLTGSTNIRFLNRVKRAHQYHFSCMDLTLPKAQSDAILPMLIDIHPIFTINEEPFTINEEPFTINEEPFTINEEPLSVWGFFDGSTDGHMRGFYFGSLRYDRPHHFLKITIDGSEDPCIATVGELIQMVDETKRVPTFQPMFLKFDGMCGKFLLEVAVLGRARTTTYVSGRKELVLDIK